MLNQLAIEFKGELNCIGDNMEKYITFLVPIKKEVINNNGDKKIITYKLKFIDSFRFMSTSLSELIDNMPINIWTAGKNLMQIHYHLKKIFIVILIEKILAMRIISMLKKYGMYLK